MGSPYARASVRGGGPGRPGVPATPELARKVAAEELDAIRKEIGEEAFAAGRWQQAHDLLLQVALDEVTPTS